MKLCQDVAHEKHGIGSKGELTAPDIHTRGDDRKDVFFNEANFGKRYVSRAVLVDLEPRVLNEITSEENFCCNLFNPDNIFHEATGGEAGNNWGKGFNQPEENINQIFDIVTAKVERADSFESFAMIHSIMGGTGSGLGSRLLQEIYDRFPKAITHTYTVMSPLFPDVNVAPYNVIPSLGAISEYTNLSILFDNDAFHRFSKNGTSRGGKGRPDDSTIAERKNYTQINSMMSQIMTSLSAPIRYYNPVYSRMMNISAQLNPFPPLQFILPAFTPFTPLSSTSSVNQPIIFSDTRHVVSHMTNPNQLISSTDQLAQKMADEEKARLERRNTAVVVPTTVPRSVSEANIPQSTNSQTQTGGTTMNRRRAPSANRPVSHIASSTCSNESDLQTTPTTSITPTLPRKQSTVALNKKDYCLISELGIIQVDKASAPEMDSKLTYLQKCPNMKTPAYSYPPWLPSSATYALAKTRLSPYMDNRQYPISGLFLANHSSVSVTFQQMLQKYNEQRRGKAFLRGYEEENVVDQMDTARNTFENIVGLYGEINTMEFLQGI